MCLKDYVAELEVYFNDRLIEVCKLPLKYNHRKHELFFNYVQSYGKYTVTCKWVNLVEGADIWVRDVISYTTVINNVNVRAGFRCMSDKKRSQPYLKKNEDDGF